MILLIAIGESGHVCKIAFDVVGRQYGWWGCPSPCAAMRRRGGGRAKRQGIRTDDASRSRWVTRWIFATTMRFFTTYSPCRTLKSFDLGSYPKGQRPQGDLRISPVKWKWSAPIHSQMRMKIDGDANEGQPCSLAHWRLAIAVSHTDVQFRAYVHADRSERRGACAEMTGRMQRRQTPTIASCAKFKDTPEASVIRGKIVYQTLLRVVPWRQRQRRRAGSQDSYSDGPPICTQSRRAAGVSRA